MTTTVDHTLAGGTERRLPDGNRFLIVEPS
jgi:hypothetical protein